MTVEVIKTIKAAGGDYSLLSTWEASEQTNLVSADQIAVAECYNDWPTGLVDNLAIAGWTTDATRYVEIRAASGSEFKGVFGGGFFITSNATDGTVRLAQSHVKLTGIEIRNTTNAAAVYDYSGLTLATISRCGLYATALGTSTPILTGVAGNIAMDRCGVISSGRGADFRFGATGSTCKNSAFKTKGTHGILGGINTNTVVHGATSACFYTPESGSNYCASSDATAPSTNYVRSLSSSAFVNLAGYDLHLASGSPLIGVGTNLSGSFTADIDGDAWPDSGAWDIGFDHPSTGGGGVALSGNASAIASASGGLAIAVPLSGSSVAVATATGQISAAIPLAGAAAAVSSANGGLSVGISLSGTALAQTIASGALSSAFPLAGGAVAQAAALGSLSIQFALNGTAIAQATATGNLNPGNSNALGGNAQAQSQAAGQLSIAIPLAGNAQVVATASGNLGSGTQLGGAAVAAASANGNLAVTVTLSGAALAQAIAAGGLAISLPLSGNAIAQAAAVGYLNGTEMKSLRHVVMPETNLGVRCPDLPFMVAHP